MPTYIGELDEGELEREQNNDYIMCFLVYSRRVQDTDCLHIVVYLLNSLIQSKESDRLT